MLQKKSPVTGTFRTSVSRFIKIKEKVGEGRVVVQKWLAVEKYHPISFLKPMQNEPSKKL